MIVLSNAVTAVSWQLATYTRAQVTETAGPVGRLALILIKKGWFVRKLETIGFISSDWRRKWLQINITISSRLCVYDWVFEWVGVSDSCQGSSEHLKKRHRSIIHRVWTQHHVQNSMVFEKAVLTQYGERELWFSDYTDYCNSPAIAVKDKMELYYYKIKFRKSRNERADCYLVRDFLLLEV